MQQKEKILKQFLLSVLCYLTVDKMIKMNTLTEDHRIEAHDTHNINKKKVLEKSA